jgi:hypothetical protein
MAESLLDIWLDLTKGVSSLQSSNQLGRLGAKATFCGAIAEAHLRGSDNAGDIDFVAKGVQKREEDGGASNG